MTSVDFDDPYLAVDLAVARTPPTGLLRRAAVRRRHARAGTRSERLGHRFWRMSRQRSVPRRRARTRESPGSPGQLPYIVEEVGEVRPPAFTGLAVRSLERLAVVATTIVLPAREK